MVDKRRDRADGADQGAQGFERIINRDLCRTEAFWDREVELVRCLESKKCPHKRFYLHMAICTCPVS